MPGSVVLWNDQDIVLFHGTLDVEVASIMQGVDLDRCRSLRDFGRGFYTTTNQQQAERWARDLANQAQGTAAVIRFTVTRNDLASLDCLVFVRGDTQAFDYWSFVEYCRTTTGDHRRAHAPWYDVVAGPITGSWRKRTVILNSDQFSFHTPGAIAILDNSPKARIL